MNTDAQRRLDLELFLFADLDLPDDCPPSLYDLMIEIVRSHRIPRRSIAEELSRMQRR